MSEIKKIRYRQIWVLIAAIALFEWAWLAWSLRSGGKFARSEEGFYYMLLGLAMINTIVQPVAAAMLASRLCDMENKGNTGKLLGTIQTMGSVYDCKILTATFYIAVVALSQGVIILLFNAAGKYLEHPLTYGFFQHVLATFLVTEVLYLLQQILSFQFENQIIALTVGIVGAFGGLFSWFFSFDMFLGGYLQNLFPWCYYGLLGTVHQDWNETTRISSYYPVSFSMGNLVCLCIWGMILYGAGKLLYSRKEV